MTMLYRLIVPGVVLAVGLAGIFVVADALGRNDHAAERRALMARSAELTARALASGSALSCLDAAAGEATETACEAAVFGSPQATAAAVAYVGARLDLLADAATTPEVAPRLAGIRRAIELDRFGIAAQVLNHRDGCSATQCSGFALVADANMLKSNIKAQTFDQYVSRHAAAWVAPQPAQPAAPANSPANSPAMSQGPVPPALPQTASAQPPAEGRPVSSKYDFPSAASIPPVSIMNTEPPLSKEAAAAKAEALVKAAPGDKTPPVPIEPGKAPVPPKRPQVPNEPQ